MDVGVRAEIVSLRDGFDSACCIRDTYCGGPANLETSSVTQIRRPVYEDMSVPALAAIMRPRIRAPLHVLTRLPAPHD